MKEIIDYTLVGILQGILEWLPISSQGNLMIYISNRLGISSVLSLNYSILLHLGTLLASITYFRKEILLIFSLKNIKILLKENFKLLKIKENSNKEEENLYLLRFIFISVIFTLLISSPIYFFIKENISSLSISLINLTIGILLLITGLLILFSNKIIFKDTKLSVKNSILLGIFQGFSIIPGLSRSGLTTSLLLFRGFSPEKSFRISFLLSIPTILIGELGLLILNGVFFSSYIIISIITSFFIGYLTIDILIKFAKKINFSYFCFILGFLYIINFFI